VRGIKVYPPSEIFAKLANKNAIKNQKFTLPQKLSQPPIYPPSQNLAKTSWTLPLDFQTVCIYGEGAPHVPPLKTLKNLVIKMQ
jgi:hypothetical protein